MASRNKYGWSICSMLLLSACSSGTPSDEVGITSHIRATSTQTINTQMTLPSTLSSAGFLVAQTKVQLDSGVIINGTVWSAGTVSMQPDVKVQAVTCTGNVLLTDRDTITTLTTGGTITQGNGDLLGTVNRTALTNVASSTSVTFPAASQTITLNSGQSKTLSPGSYVSVTANSGATLTLLAGDYYFSTFGMESSSVLKLSPTQGATRIFIATSFTAYRPTLASGADASRLFVEYLGTNPVVLETPFSGSIVAPRASLTVGTASSQLHRGSFTAQSIEVQPNAKLEFVSFNPAGTTSSCAAGTWERDGNPFTPCVAKTTCAAGSYVSNEGSTTSDRTCTGCTSGQYSSTPNATSCQPWSNCAAGTYVSNTPSSTVNRLCVACPAGQYSSGNNQSQCLNQGACAAGTVQTAAGTPTSPPVCSACVAGQYCAGGTNPQTTCVPGTWDHDSNPATACAAKTTCMAGNYVANEGTTTSDRTCASCASGTFSTVTDAATCTAWSTCLAGSYVTNTPSTTVDRVCSPCPSGQYSSSNNQTSCQAQGTCAAGTVQTAPGTATSAAICAACAPGNYCAGGQSPQIACASGTWDHDGNAATPCVEKTSCSPGTFVASEGTAIADRVCSSCGSGQFSTTSNAVTCSPWSTCEAGTYVSNTPSATVDRVCTPCASGQYSSGPNQSSCQDQGSCTAGTVQTAPGTLTSAAVCQACVAGQFCAGGTSPQTTCGSGTWDHDGNPATPCAALSVCAPGTWMAADGTSTTDRVCTPCANGSFSTTANATACIAGDVFDGGSDVADGATDDGGSDVADGVTDDGGSDVADGATDAGGCGTDGTPCAFGLCIRGVCMAPTNLTSSTDLSTASITPGRSCAEAPEYALKSLSSDEAVVASAPDCLAVGDEVLLINLQGAPGAVDNVGNWELVSVTAISGTDVHFAPAKTKRYGAAAGTDTGIGTGTTDQKVAMIRVPQFGALTVGGDLTLTSAAWNGSTGGVVVLRAASLTVAGDISAAGLGYRGGRWSRDTEACTNSVDTEAGESIDGLGLAGTANNIGGAGGISAASGSSFNSNSPLQSGAGHALAGQMGSNGGPRTVGPPGTTYGANDASKLTMGSGQGGNVTCANGFPGPALVPGGEDLAGGVVLLLAQQLQVNAGGRITASASASSRDVSASGGYVFIRGATLSLGTGQVTALGGTGLGVNGPTLGMTVKAGDGYVVIQGTTVTGTTIPAANRL